MKDDDSAMTLQALGSWRGIVDWYDVRKGYGFLKPTVQGVLPPNCPLSQQDVFVHQEAILGDEGAFRKLRRNQTVAFEVILKDDGRLGATSVQLV
jgi:cold shock CspA family protein